MNLSESGVLSVKSSAEWYPSERDGFKPNTIRVVTPGEKAMCEQALRIRVHRANSPECFVRAITDVSDVTGVLTDGGFMARVGDQHVIVISWEA